MKPKKSGLEEIQEHLFGQHLERLVGKNHELVSLSQAIDWASLDEEFGATYSEKKGRPGNPTRLMVGLQYLKYTYDLSDEETLQRWLENPYWQYFCGEKYFQYELSIDPTSMTRYRKRLGEEGVERLLQETVRAGLKLKVLKPQSLEKLVVDTTVQEKAITFPTDTKLLNKMRVELVKMAQKTGVPLRQSYVRVGRKALILASRYFHARQHKRGRRQVKKLRTYLGRVMRDIGRKIAGQEELEEFFREALSLAERVLKQSKNSKDKVYSIHAPEVACIAKGKAHKKYEFGSKVSVGVTAKEGFIVGVKSFRGNPHDGKTLQEALEQIERVTQCEFTGELFVDRGYRGHNYKGEGTVHIDGKKNVPPRVKRWRKRRSLVEAKISHMKHHSRMDRNFLLGECGDQINAVLSGCGVNLRKLIGQIYLLFRAFFLKSAQLASNVLCAAWRNIQTLCVPLCPPCFKYVL